MYIYIYSILFFCIHLFLPVVVSRSCIHCFQGALKLQDLQVFLTKPYYSNKDRQRSTYLGAGDIWWWPFAWMYNIRNFSGNTPVLHCLSVCPEKCHCRPTTWPQYPSHHHAPQKVCVCVTGWTILKQKQTWFPLTYPITSIKTSFDMMPGLLEPRLSKRNYQIPSWELTYLISPSKGTFEDDFPFPQVG